MGAFQRHLGTDIWAHMGRQPPPGALQFNTRHPCTYMTIYKYIYICIYIHVNTGLLCLCVHAYTCYVNIGVLWPQPLWRLAFGSCHRIHCRTIPDWPEKKTLSQSLKLFVFLRTSRTCALKKAPFLYLCARDRHSRILSSFKECLSCDYIGERCLRSCSL